MRLRATDLPSLTLISISSPGSTIVKGVIQLIISSDVNTFKELLKDGFKNASDSNVTALKLTRIVLNRKFQK